MSNLDSPIPLSEIESVLAWVDTFKLSRQTKKINRDFSDAVLLAEILAVHYPKLVEMHNYPPRNSHSLKLNNWLTLNRKVLKKLKLNLCCNTMEQLANCNAGVIERVLVMVRDKIRRDEDLNKSMKDAEQTMSSGGSYYEACGDEENVLVVPVKARVNGVLETVHQKVVNYESYQALKEELRDARDSADVLKQKVEHLDNLLDLKEQRIEELQKQLDRKQARRKEAEAFQNSLQVPFETVPSPTVPILVDNTPTVDLVVKAPIPKPVEAKISKEDTKIPVKQDSTIKLNVASKPSLTEVTTKDIEQYESINTSFNKPAKVYEENRNAFANVTEIKPHITKIIVNNQHDYDLDVDVDRVKSDVFKEIEIIEERYPDYDEFEDSQQDNVTTIEQTIQNEIKHISNPMQLVSMEYRQERPIEYRQEMPMEFRQDINSVN